MTSLWFVVPAHGRLELSRICLRQLRRTCDALAENGIKATAVVVADDGNLETAREVGFGTVERDNQFVSRRFNDGVQAAFDPYNPAPGGESGLGRYEVIGSREYRGNGRGSVFEAKIPPGPERRAVLRGDIRLLSRVTATIPPGALTMPDNSQPADYVVMIGSDDWVDWRILLNLPEPDEIVGFQYCSFVREDGIEMTKTFLDYVGGCGIRIYPRPVMASAGFRPADEALRRGCDTSIRNNLLDADANLRIMHVVTDPRQIVDWKTPGQQLNDYRQIRARHSRKASVSDPFEDLADVFPAEALEEMQDHYHKRGAEMLLTR